MIRLAATFLAVLCSVALGCASTQMVTVSYATTGISLPLMGESKVSVKLVIVDERDDPELLGITTDIYTERIQLTRPPLALVLETFELLLSE